MYQQIHSSRLRITVVIMTQYLSAYLIVLQKFPSLSKSDLKAIEVFLISIKLLLLQLQNYLRRLFLFCHDILPPLLAVYCNLLMQLTFLQIFLSLVASSSGIQVNGYSKNARQTALTSERSALQVKLLTQQGSTRLRTLINLQDQSFLLPH